MGTYCPDMQKWVLAQIGYDQTLAFQVEKQSSPSRNAKNGWRTDKVRSKGKVDMSHFTSAWQTTSQLCLVNTITIKPIYTAVDYPLIFYKIHKLDVIISFLHSFTFILHGLRSFVVFSSYISCQL